MFLATKIALIHSDVSEMMEGLRKDLADDHLPNEDMEAVEGADVFIRLCDYMGRREFNFMRLVKEKLQYNWFRADHNRANRGRDGGKKF